MLIGIVGPQLSGKKTVLRYLTKQLQFTELTISPSGSKNEFSNLSEAVNFATTNWRERYVIQNIDRYKHQDLLFKRPFFLLLYIESSSFIRYSRSVKNISLESLTISDGIAIERFLLKDDCQLYTPFGNVADKDELYNTTTTLYDCSKLSNYQVLNNSTIAALYEQLLNLDLLNPERTRPCWDTYFMALCELASQRSNCMKRRVGCIIVSECRVISTGYNGTPKNLKNCNEGGCARCNGNATCGSNLDTCICMHAEENALLEAGRERLSNKKVTLYCSTCPCLGCAKKIIQVGIKQVVYAKDYGLDKLAAAIFEEAGVKLRQIAHLTVSIK